MAPLPVCRWRKEEVPGHYVCRSVKFFDPPNVVSAAFCAKCCYADHDPPAPLAPSLPCVHLGERLEKNIQAHGDSVLGDVFVCALHGRCTIDAVDQSQPAEHRSCIRCTDYLPREPFGPNSALMARLAEDCLAAVPAYPRGTYQGRGIVIAGGGDRFFPSLYVTIRALRHVGCRLPIQVWYLGRNREMRAERKWLLAPFQVECIDADRIRRLHPARHLNGWELKVFATLHSPFEEVLFLDADCYPCRNPEFLFELADYRARGAIFWPDRVTIDRRLKWPAYGVPDPRRLGSIESGQFVVNKKPCWQPLNLAWFYNDHSEYYYRYGYGDKHTFEAAWARCGRPFVMWEPLANWVEVAYLHLGPDRRPLFVHRCSDKFRFDSHSYTTRQHTSLASFCSALPLERECWGWMSELAWHTGRTLANQKTTKLLKPSRQRRADGNRFAIATLYTSEIAPLGRRTSRVMWAYARRHGYEAVIASAAIDATRHPPWSKILLVQRYLLENPACKWVMWMDADAVIMNPRQRLEDFVDETVDFVVAEDLPPNSINSGVFLVRNCPAMLDLLRRAYAKTQYFNSPWPEQTALFEALRESSETVRARIVSRRLFNSFADEYRKGDFMIHFAGCSSDAKLAGVTKAVASATKRCR